MVTALFCICIFRVIDQIIGNGWKKSTFDKDITSALPCTLLTEQKKLFYSVIFRAVTTVSLVGQYSNNSVFVNLRCGCENKNTDYAAY